MIEINNQFAYDLDDKKWVFNWMLLINKAVINNQN